MNTDLSSLARTLAERHKSNIHRQFCITRESDVAEDEAQLSAIEAVIREAIEKTLDAPILREAINDIPHVSDCDMQYMDGELDPDNCWRCGLENAIRSLKPVAIQK